MEECIPKRRLPNRKNLPWLNRKLVTSMKKRNLLYRRAKRTGDYIKYKIARNKLVNDMRKAKSTYFKKLNPKNPKEFWRAVKFLNKKQSSIPTLSKDSCEATTGPEKANLLNTYFSECFNHSVQPLSNEDVDIPLQLISDPNNFPHELECNEENVCELLGSLDINKSNGPDGISARMLKHTAASISPSITQLFNQSLHSCRVPSEWKSSLVVPIPKGSDAGSPNNYRPISLLVVLSKILEKHVHSIITQHLNLCHPISNQQWGFTAGRSTIGALLSTVHDWFKLLEEGKDICAVFLDYRKAFDSVPHRTLIEKLEGIGVNPYIIAWLSDYLTSRKQRVVVDGSMSSPTDVFSGVPQGSILGPLLFLIYIDGVTEVELSNNSRLVLYADDVLIYSPISCHTDCQLLQHDINTICAWSIEQHLTLNPQKCKFTTISRKRKPTTTPFTFKLNNFPMEEVDQFKYLGVLFCHNLSWSPHITATCAKAKKILGLLYRRFYNHSSSECLKQLYLSLVRPHLDYAAQVWDPYLQKDVQLLENTQKFALKLISHNWSTSYQDLLSLSDLPTLSTRRLHLKLSQVYKIVYNLCHFPDHIFEERQAYSERLRRPRTLHQPFAHSNAYLNSFVPSSVQAWNNLTEQQVTCPSLKSFKSSLL